MAEVTNIFPVDAENKIKTIIDNLKQNLLFCGGINIIQGLNEHREPQYPSDTRRLSISGQIIDKEIFAKNQYSIYEIHCDKETNSIQLNYLYVVKVQEDRLDLDLQLNSL